MASNPPSAAAPSMHALGGTMLGSKAARAERIGKLVYPIFAGPTESEINALKDLSTLSRLNYTRLSTQQQEEDWVKKVPSILQSVLDIISRGTGAATYAYAAWDDMGKRTVITEATGLTLHDFVDSEQAEEVRAIITQYVFEKIGPSFTRDWRKAWPAVVGHPKDDYRPRLPSRNPNPVEEAWQLDNFMNTLAYWQGTIGELPLDAITEDIQSGSYAYIERKRLPPGLTAFAPAYSEWDEKDLYTLTEWIRTQQLYLDMGEPDAEETMFQFAQLTLNNGEDHQAVTRYQRAIAENCLFEYAPAAAFYYAATFNIESTLTTREQSALIKSLIDGERNLRLLLTQILSYERSMAPHAQDLPLSRQPVPPMVLQTAGDQRNLDQLLANPAWGSLFFDWNAPQSDEWSIRKLAKWLRGGGLIDASTNLIWRGPCGVFCAFLVLLRIQVSIKSQTPEVSSSDDGVWHYGENELEAVNQLAMYLRSEITRSALVLAETNEASVQSAQWDSPWETDAIVWSDGNVVQNLHWSWVTQSEEDLESHEPDETNNSDEETDTDDSNNMKVDHKTMEVDNSVKIKESVPPEKKWVDDASMEADQSSNEDIPPSSRVIIQKSADREEGDPSVAPAQLVYPVPSAKAGIPARSALLHKVLAAPGSSLPVRLAGRRSEWRTRSLSGTGHPPEEVQGGALPPNPRHKPRPKSTDDETKGESTGDSDVSKSMRGLKITPKPRPPPAEPPENAGEGSTGIAGTNTPRAASGGSSLQPGPSTMPKKPVAILLKALAAKELQEKEKTKVPIESEPPPKQAGRRKAAKRARDLKADEDEGRRTKSRSTSATSS